MKLKRDCFRLYAVTDRAWLNGVALESQVADAIAGGAGIVQLREKALDDAAFLAEARWFVPLCKSLAPSALSTTMWRLLWPPARTASTWGRRTWPP